MINKNEALAESTAIAVSQLMPNIVRGVHLDFFAERTVTQTQFFMLVAAHSFGSCTMTVLAQSLKIKLPTATGIIDRLAKGGYVRRAAVPEDRRQVMIELTPKGVGFIGDFQNEVRRRWREVLKPLSAAELKAFRSVVVKLRNTLRAGS